MKKPLATLAIAATGALSMVGQTHASAYPPQPDQSTIKVVGQQCDYDANGALSRASVTYEFDTTEDGFTLDISAWYPEAGENEPQLVAMRQIDIHHGGSGDGTIVWEPTGPNSWPGVWNGSRRLVFGLAYSDPGSDYYFSKEEFSDGCAAKKTVTTTTTTQSTTTTIAKKNNKDLPNTGLSGEAAGLGVFLLSVGAGLVIASRRRPNADDPTVDPT